MEQPQDDIWIDGNGALAERTSIGGLDAIVHYDDLPAKDLTTVDGIPCTTALRTVLDLAVEHTDRELERMIDDCLRRRLFTVGEALARCAEPDMLIRSGAQRVRRLLSHRP